MGRWCRAAVVILLFSLPEFAVCEENPLWELGAGLALLQMPDYSGSDKDRLYLLPYPYFIYRGDILNIDRDRISGRVFKSDKILFDFSFFGQAPVDSSDNETRRGMPDLDPTFEVGPSLTITLLENRQDRYKLNLFLPVRAVFSTDFSSVHREGWVFSPRLVFEKSDILPATGLNLGMSLGPIFADSAYHRYYYSVDPVYATASRPSYSAEGGYSGTALTLGLSKGYNQLIFSAFVSINLLHGAVIEDSPLVKTKTSVMSGFMVSWIFLKSARKVTAER
jgi:outer membrane scaffolding protein for murein synthesis (MipA/OmpV family)